MDKGAHFHRCDFQVHTPRDPRWHGLRPVLEAERVAYARDFIAACREKGLQAVAITDHHDFGFFPYLRAASHAETDATGATVSEAARIKVFPGLELTLAVPCQALLLLDEDFPNEWLGTVLTRLNIVPNDYNESKHGETVRLAEFKSLSAVCETLDSHAKIKGKYILLPNLKDGGDGMMREGFHEEYRTMPCVGGYLDGGVEQLSKGKRGILDGKQSDHGYRPLGIFPTSDNRNRDFSLLGTYTAWVKWSEPSAEALRQACLARKTRILHIPPQTPSVAIGRIEVSNSRFLGPLNLAFNNQFNCLIGGRGTGKSTVIEYLR